MIIKYFNLIIVNLTDTSFTTGIVTEYTTAGSCRFAWPPLIGNIYKAVIASIIYL